MAEEKKAQPTEYDRIYCLQNRLDKYQRICRNPDLMKAINLPEMCAAMDYMTEQFIEGHQSSVERIFIGYLKIVSTLAKKPSSNFANCFAKITVMICEFCSKIGLYVHDVLEEWLHCLLNIPMDLRYTIFLSIASHEFDKCAKFMANAPTFSMQNTMLDILCAYMESDYDSMINWLCTFFLVDCVCSEQDTDSNMEIDTDSDIENDTDYMHVMSTLQSIDTKCLFAIDYTKFDEKQELLYHLNRRLKDSSIITEEIDTVKFGSETIYFDNNSYIHFNKPSKSIEHWITYKNINFKGNIYPQNVVTVNIKDYVSPYVLEAVFILKSTLRYKTDNQTVKNKKLLESDEITLTFDCGFRKEIFQSLIEELFGKVFNVLSVEQSHIDVSSDYDYDNDPDFEIIENIINESPEKIFPSEVEPNEDKTSDMSPAERPRLSKEFFTVPMPDSSTPSLMEKLGEKRSSSYDAPDDKSINEPKKPKLSKKPDGIPTASFYTKPMEPEKRVRSIRESALKASTAIEKMSLDSPVIELPKKRKQIPERDQISVPLPPLKRRNLQPQYHKDDDNVIDLVNDAEDEPKIEKVDHTRSNFRQSMARGAQKENNQILSNLAMINDDVKSRTNTVSYSYRRAKEIVSRQADSTIDSGKSMIIPQMNLEKIDVNANINPICQCKISSNANNLAHLASSVASDLEMVSCECQTHEFQQFGLNEPE